ncbi:hypothetical protein EON65_38095 [archaeon]|nr:MAG: hypothetical protein EON65_38095 [archaeon]
MQADDGNECFRLKDMDALEQAWFRDKMARYMSDNELIKKTVPNMMVTNLVKKVDRMFHDFICTTWRPVALMQIRQVQEKLEERMVALGPKTTDMSSADLLQDIVSQIKDQWTADSVLDIKTMPVNGRWGTKEWAWQQAYNRAAFEAWFTIFTGDESQHLAELMQIFNNAFNENTPMKTARFVLVQDFMLSKMNETFENAMSSNRRKMFEIAEAELDRMLAIHNAGSVQDVANIVTGMVLVKCVLPALRVADTIQLGTDMMVESPKYAARRLFLEDMLRRVRSSVIQIENIQNAFNA